MTVEHAPDPSADGRVSTGTPGLDAMLEGGLVSRRPYLIVGPSGTGKTTLALRFLCEGVRHGEHVLFVTMEEPPNEVRVNHRGLGEDLLGVDVFDAIPDIMRYERVPFKDIAAVRHAAPFAEIPLEIRRSPELAAVEVTMTGLEQMLRTEVVRRNYSRVVIDSLTAFQYFCMKGFDPVAGAQAFLRFLSDLKVTTLLTVESPLEDADTPERTLARGEIRLFRWELEGRTVRAIGVEKFRGSSHDVRLHPYRIGGPGLQVNLNVTISRDTRQIIEEPRLPEVAPTIPASAGIESSASPFDSLAEEVRDLVLIGAEVGAVRTEIEAALGAAAAGEIDRSRGHISRAQALALDLSDALRRRMEESPPVAPGVAEAYQRIVERSEAARAGIPPTRLPPTQALQIQLEWVLSTIPRAPAAVGTPMVEVPAGSSARAVVEGTAAPSLAFEDREAEVPPPPALSAAPAGTPHGPTGIPSTAEPEAPFPAVEGKPSEPVETLSEPPESTTPTPSLPTLSPEALPQPANAPAAAAEPFRGTPGEPGESGSPALPVPLLEAPSTNAWAPPTERLPPPPNEAEPERALPPQGWSAPTLPGGPLPTPRRKTRLPDEPAPPAPGPASRPLPSAERDRRPPLPFRGAEPEPPLSQLPARSASPDRPRTTYAPVPAPAAPPPLREQAAASRSAGSGAVQPPPSRDLASGPLAVRQVEPRKAEGTAPRPPGTGSPVVVAAPPPTFVPPLVAPASSASTPPSTEPASALGRESPTGMGSAPSAPPKRKRRASPSPRKKAAAAVPTGTTPLVPAPPSDTAAAAAASPRPAAMSVGTAPEVTTDGGAAIAAPKPKRRAPRKRTAPTVVRARAGAIPSAEPPPKAEAPGATPAPSESGPPNEEP